VELTRVDGWGDVPDAGRVIVSPQAAASDVFSVAWVRVGDAAWQALDAPWELAEGAPVMRALADALLVAVARRTVRRARTPGRAAR
jgi:hypothetical protein